MVGMILRRIRGLRSKTTTAAIPIPNPVAAPPIDPNISVRPYAVDAQTPVKAPSKSPRIGSRYRMAAPVYRLADDKRILTRSPGSAPNGLATRLSIFALARQLRQPCGVDSHPPQAPLRSVTTRAYLFDSFFITMPMYLFGVPAHHRHADGGNADLFDGSLDQSNGLIADPSGRGQQDGVHAFFFQQIGRCRGCFVDQRPGVRPLDVSHKRNMSV